MEFRHASWFSDDVYEALRSQDVALVAVDAGREEGAGSPLVPTASWGYVRMRRGEYATTSWRNGRGGSASQQWSEAYVFVKHEEGQATGTRTRPRRWSRALSYSTT